MSRLPETGLYAITDRALTADAHLISSIEQALAGGAALVQYRDKSADHPRRREQAGALAILCRGYAVPLIINDDVELAAEVEADGVHLGQDDPALAVARARLGARAIIGVSCYNSLERARQAADAGADYLAFGRFFPSSSKPLAVQAHPELLRQARREFCLPLAAIGGITPANGGELLAAGANFLAVIHGLFGQADIRAAARAYADLFSPAPSA